MSKQLAPWDRLNHKIKTVPHTEQFRTVRSIEIERRSRIFHLQVSVQSHLPALREQRFLIRSAKTRKKREGRKEEEICGQFGKVSSFCRGVEPINPGEEFKTRRRSRFRSPVRFKFLAREWSDHKYVSAGNRAGIHGNSLIELFWFSAGRQPRSGIQRLWKILVGSVQPRKSP